MHVYHHSEILAFFAFRGSVVANYFPKFGYFGDLLASKLCPIERFQELFGVFFRSVKDLTPFESNSANYRMDGIWSDFQF